MKKKILIAGGLLIALIVPFVEFTDEPILGGPSSCVSQTAGPESSATWANDSTITGAQWDLTQRAETQDDSYETVTLSGIVAGEDPSQYLKSTDYGFAIPANATINGILVEADKSIDPLGGDVSVVDYSARLYKADVLTGDDKPNAAEWASDDNTYEEYGGVSDLWGTTWTPADINNSGFGFAISGTLNLAFTSVGAWIDHIRITVCYTPGRPTGMVDIFGVPVKIKGIPVKIKGK